MYERFLNWEALPGAGADKILPGLEQSIGLFWSRIRHWGEAIATVDNFTTEENAAILARLHRLADGQ